MGYSRSVGRITRRHDHREHDRAVSSSDDEHSGQVANTEGLHDRERDTGKNEGQVQQSGICYGEGNIPNSDKQHDDCGRHGTGNICRDRQTPSGLCHGKQTVANPSSKRQQRSGLHGRPKHQATDKNGEADRVINRGKRNQAVWNIEPDVGRVVNGVAFRVDRLRAIGNGQVPQCHAEAWRRLLARV